MFQSRTRSSKRSSSASYRTAEPPPLPSPIARESPPPTPYRPPPAPPEHTPSRYSSSGTAQAIHSSLLPLELHPARPRDTHPAQSRAPSSPARSACASVPQPVPPAAHPVPQTTASPA